jgi:hypothetical protein
MTEDELVTIPVPTRHLAAIYAFIGALDEGGVSGKPGQAAELSDEWTPDLIERQYRESPDSMKAFQDLLAGEPGKEFSTHDMVSALSLPNWKSVAGILGAYGHRVKSRYSKATFPFETRWENEGAALFSMSPEVAEIIKAI